MKLNLTFWLFRRRHQFANRIEDGLKLRVVFLFHYGEFAREISIR